MIGVVAHPEERDIVEEFFELFKTPWEFARPGRVYRVILSTNGEIPPLASGGLLLAYGVEQLACDKQLGIELEQQTSGTRTILGVDLPIYCGCCTVKSGPASDSPELLTTVQ